MSTAVKISVKTITAYARDAGVNYSNAAAVTTAGDADGTPANTQSSQGPARIVRAENSISIE